MSRTAPPHGLTGRRLAWHSLLNGLGQGLPIVVAVFAVPVLVRGLGTERFGILTLAWAVIGYFGLFDLGLGRALTQVIAEHRIRREDAGIGAVVWPALGLMLVLGVVSCAIAELASPWLVRSGLSISGPVQADALQAFRILSAAIPAVIVTAGFRGILEAYQRFDLVNAVRAPLGIVNYAGPLAVLPFTHRLGPIVLLLAVARVVSLIAHYSMCRTVVPGMRGRPRHAKVHRQLLSTGGWMTVSNILSPLMTTADRFIIGAVASAAVVAYYTAPYEMIWKVTIIAGSVANSLFPAFASTRDGEELGNLLSRGLVLTVLPLFPITLLVLVFGRDGLRVWMGAEFAARSFAVLQILAIGCFINSFAQIAFALVQGAGRSDLTAKAHVVEVPVYLVGAWLLIKHYGVEGAAMAWTIRVAIDAVLMFAFAAFICRRGMIGRFAGRWALIGTSLGLLFVGVYVSDAAFAPRAWLTAFLCLAVAAGSWQWALQVPERRRVLSWLGLART